jgi:MtN3 and saliva related transmembrane protein
MESALALIAASWAIAMTLGPVLQIRKIVEHRSARTVSIGYFLVLLVGS